MISAIQFRTYVFNICHAEVDFMQMSCLLRPQMKHFNFAVVVIPTLRLSSYRLMKFLSYEQLNILNAVYDLFFHSNPHCETRDNIKIVSILNSSCVRYRIRPIIS